MPLMDGEGKPKTTFPDGNVRFDRLPPRFGGNGSGLKLRIDAQPAANNAKGSTQAMLPFCTPPPSPAVCQGA